MKLFGTVTSPYVRRVRVVLDTLALPFDWVDTSTTEGQEALRAVTPIWKIPVLLTADGALFDSHHIIDELLSKHPSPALGPPLAHCSLEARNMHLVVDGALDALINHFYLKKDGVRVDESAYCQKQADRAASAMQWLETALPPDALSKKSILNVTELALYTALDWMTFRAVYDIEQHVNLSRFQRAHETIAGLAATSPRS